MTKAFISLAFFLSTATLCMAQNEKRIIVGYVEKIGIPAVDLELKAKLDTGATTSSIHANIIEMPDERKASDEKGTEEETTEDNDEAEDERRYITFSIVNSEEETKHLKKEIVRFVRIKKKDGDFQRRAVVMMTFCIAGQLVEGEVNLADRDHYNYDMLVGRNMLEQGHLIVDASKTFTTKPNCPEPKQAAALYYE